MSKLNRGDAINKIKSELSKFEEIQKIITFIENSERGII